MMEGVLLPPAGRQKSGWAVPATMPLKEPFFHPDWLFEIKHDGFRALAFIQGGSCRLRRFTSPMSPQNNLARFVVFYAGRSLTIATEGPMVVSERILPATLSGPLN
jgi:hypothetical protein